MKDKIFPQDRATWLLNAYKSSSGCYRLIYHNGEFYIHNGTHYERIAPEEIGKRVLLMNPGVGMYHCNQTLYILKQWQYVKTRPPSWLEFDRPDFPMHEVVSCANGLLHIPTRERRRHTPAAFITHALPFKYIKKAKRPKRWLRFLDELWGDDVEAIRLLQEWFGYCLVPDMRMDTALLIVGPPASGKTTIEMIQTEMIGRQGVQAISFDSLGERFGLANLVGKNLVVMSDLKVGKRVSRRGVQSLVTIIGRGGIDIENKGIKHIPTVYLTTRFLLISNGVPGLPDASGAILRRFKALQLLDAVPEEKQDINLVAELRGEMEGILNWALQGYDRLMKRGRFVQPASGQGVLDDLLRQGSPVRMFTEERCNIDTDPKSKVQTEKSKLFSDFQQWERDWGIRDNTSRDQFFKELKEINPRITDTRPSGTDTTRPRYVRLISLKMPLAALSRAASIVGSRQTQTTKPTPNGQE